MHIHVNDPKTNCPECTLSGITRQQAESFGIPFDSIDDETFVFKGCNSIDLMGKLCPSDPRFREWVMVNGECHVKKTDTRAVTPFKTRFSDAGYDLTIIKPVKRFNQYTTLYDTGIQLRLPHGLYAEVVPRSSLSKSGYILANSVGIIDNSYTGNIYIALTKIDEKSPDLALPFRCCQLIFRNQVYVDIVKTTTDQSTNRGDQGFGSSG